MKSPMFDPKDLRDNATPAQIEHLWGRLEKSLGSRATAAPARRSSLRWSVAAAAALLAVGFGAGALVGRGLAPEAVATAPLIQALPENDRVATEIYAAGQEARTFTLPGGARLRLAPGSTLELDRVGDKVRAMRLIQGEADARAAEALAISAGEATVETSPGSAVRLTRSSDELEVGVIDGVASVESPAGSQRLGRGEHASRIPVRASAAILPTSSATVAAIPRRSPLGTGPTIEAPARVLGEGADWLGRYNVGDYGAARELLARGPGGVTAAIATAHDGFELTALAEITWSSDQSAAIAALTRVTTDFQGGQYAQLAAYKLGKYYEQSGRPDLASHYAALARTLSPNGNLDEDALCIQIRAAREIPEAIRMASDYLLKYPDGRCRDDAERIASAAAHPGEPGGSGAAPRSSGEPSGGPSAGGAPGALSPVAPAPSDAPASPSSNASSSSAPAAP